MNTFVLTKRGLYAHHNSIAKAVGDSLYINNKDGKLIALYREYIAVFHGDAPILVN